MGISIELRGSSGKSDQTAVLGLAGMGVMFFPAAHRVLRSAFVTKKVLVTHTSVLANAGLCLHSIKAFSASHAASPSKQSSGGKRLAEGTAGMGDLNWPRGIPYHITSWSAVKTGGLLLPK